MARPRKHQEQEEPTSQPDSITELQPVVEEFMKKLQTIKNEQDLLKQDEKELMEEYKNKLDTKTLAYAIKSVNLKSKVTKKDTFDMFVEILERVV